MAGLQVGQMVSKQWVEGFNQQIFGNDSTQSISRENLLAGFVAGVIGKGGAMEYDESSRVHAYSDGCHQRKSNRRKVC